MPSLTDHPAHYDVLLVGGGLQSSLVAMALLAEPHPVRIGLIERGAAIGGNHTWCFHEADVPAEAAALVEPLIQHRWDGYDVRFPDSRRRLDCAYSGLSSEHLHRVVTERFAARPNCDLHLGAEATELRADAVRLSDGRELRASLVLDARGPKPEPTLGAAGFQKFVGRELELRHDHGLERPIVMDARVDQRDGYRFFYVLPLGPRRVLVEDTRFADSPELDVAALTAEVDAYAREQGFEVQRVVRTEKGVLPMPWEHSPLLSSASPFALGYRGGWMHPATGYSFPVAVRIAQLVARRPTEAQLAAGLRELARELRPQLAFARTLNRLLFRWYLPERRTAVFERFYRLPDPTIRRFFALACTPMDRVRILSGRPPRGLSLRARLTSARRLSNDPQHNPAVTAGDRNAT